MIRKRNVGAALLLVAFVCQVAGAADAEISLDAEDPNLDFVYFHHPTDGTPNPDGSVPRDAGGVTVTMDVLGGDPDLSAVVSGRNIYPPAANTWRYRDFSKEQPTDTVYAAMSAFGTMPSLSCEISGLTDGAYKVYGVINVYETEEYPNWITAIMDLDDGSALAYPEDHYNLANSIANDNYYLAPLGFTTPPIRCRMAKSTVGMGDSDYYGLAYVREPLMAYGPTPANRAVDVLADGDLGWKTGDDPNDLGQPDPAITLHVLYLDPNSAWVASAEPDDPAAIVITDGGTGTTTYDPGSLVKDTMHYWRVDEAYGSVENPTIFKKGMVWSFRTEKEFPVIITQPQDQAVKEGGAAVFTVEATDPLSGTLDYEWRDPADQLVGGNSPTLTISPVAVADEGAYYCKVTNASGTVDSAAANLTAGRLVGRWLVATTGSDPNDLLQDVSGEDNHGVFYGGGLSSEAGPEAGSLALDFDGTDDYIEVADDAVLNYRDAVTVACWAKDNWHLNQWNFLAQKGIYHGTWELRRYNGYYVFRTNGNSWEDYLAGSQWATGDWVYVTCVYDGTNDYMYHDGRLVASRSDTGAMKDTTGEPLIIGTRQTAESSFDSYFFGSLSDLRLYNYGLNAAEVGELYYNATGEEFCYQSPMYDFNGDCYTDLEDLAMFAATWLDCGWIPDCLP